MRRSYSNSGLVGDLERVTEPDRDVLQQIYEEVEHNEGGNSGQRPSLLLE